MLALGELKTNEPFGNSKRRLAERAEGRWSVAHLSTRASIDQYSQSMNIIRKDEPSREQR